MDAIQNRAAHRRAVHYSNAQSDFGHNDYAGKLTMTSAQAKVPNVSYSGTEKESK